MGLKCMLLSMSRLTAGFAAEAAAAAEKADREQISQWRGESPMADPLDMTFPDLDSQGPDGSFADMFPSGGNFAFPSLPSGLMYTGGTGLNDSTGQYRSR